MLEARRCYIVAGYHCMQFQGKLINQASENGKKPNSGPDFGPFSQSLGHKFIFFKNLALLVSIVGKRVIPHFSSQPPPFSKIHPF